MQPEHAKCPCPERKAHAIPLHCVQEVLFRADRIRDGRHEPVAQALGAGHAPSETETARADFTRTLGTCPKAGRRLERTIRAALSHRQKPGDQVSKEGQGGHVLSDRPGTMRVQRPRGRAPHVLEIINATQCQNKIAETLFRPR